MIVDVDTSAVGLGESEERGMNRLLLLFAIDVVASCLAGTIRGEADEEQDKEEDESKGTGVSSAEEEEVDGFKLVIKPSVLLLLLFVMFKFSGFEDDDDTGTTGTEEVVDDVMFSVEFPACLATEEAEEEEVTFF